ncbi:MAG: lytic transglycosylase domain-containing protein [Pseudomonadota bacterium]
MPELYKKPYPFLWHVSRPINLSFTSFIVLSTFLIFMDSASAITRKERSAFVAQICHRIEVVAGIHGLPSAFLARLIWKESRFNPNAVSPKGAMGIAQFMPGTADQRGLKDPFEPHSSIVASALFLHDLRNEFGNWGLAAAGYNAGPGRVRRWLSRQSGLPFETQDFVASITGHTAGEWREKNFPKLVFSLGKEHDFQTACRNLPTLFTGKQYAYGDTAPPKAWGVHIAANFSRGKALSTFRRLQKQFPGTLGKHKPSVVRIVNLSMGNRPRYEVQVGAQSRNEGEALCQKHKRAGGACIVLRN